MKSKNVLKLLNVTRQTLTKYVKDKKIRVNVLPNGFYDYNDDDVYSFIGVKEPRKTVIYARVSTQKQKNDLLNQVDRVTDYCNKNGLVVERVYSDIASGLSYDRGEFRNMLDDIINHRIKSVYISNKDRLTRISYDMWKQLFKNFNCELHTINEASENNENTEKEIFSDIISLLHCFAMRIYSARRKKKIQIVEEDLQNEIGL